MKFIVNWYRCVHMYVRFTCIEIFFGHDQDPRFLQLKSKAETAVSRSSIAQRSTLPSTKETPAELKIETQSMLGVVNTCTLYSTAKDWLASSVSSTTKHVADKCALTRYMMSQLNTTGTCTLYFRFFRSSYKRYASLSQHKIKLI